MRSMRVWIGLAVLAGAPLFGESRAHAESRSDPLSVAEDASPVADILVAMAQRGEIGFYDAYRLAAEAQQSFDAPRLKKSQGHGTHCMTAAIREVRTWARSRGVRVLRDPPPSFGAVVSETFPIRVHYPMGAEAVAKLVLKAAEKTWNQQIVEYGYTPPWADGEMSPVSLGTDIYLAPTGDEHTGGFTEPLAEVPDTPICDCSCRIVVSPNLTPDEAEYTVAHEFNHATQMAVDCTEAISAFENFATAVELSLYPAELSTESWKIAEFQSHPEAPVDYWTSSIESDPSAGYQYGAALFPFFLKERFGKGELRFLRDTWNAFAQEGTIVPGIQFGCSQPNKPNWFDGVDTMAKKNESSFDQAFDEFSAWRAIAGPWDDGAHFSFGKSINPAAIAASHSLLGLPVSGELSSHEYGSQHVELKTEGTSGPLTIKIKGDPEATWGASLLIWRENTAVERLIMTLKGGKGNLDVPSLLGAQRVVLVVSQKKYATHNPDYQHYGETRSFTYSIDVPAQPDASPDAPAEAEASVPSTDATAANDAQVEIPDASSEPAPSKPVDASTDAATPSQPTASSPALDDGGCGCRVAGSSRTARPLALFALSALAAMRKSARRRGTRSKIHNTALGVVR